MTAQIDMDFTIAEHTERGVPVLAVGGEADVVTAPRLGEALAAVAGRGAPTVVVDLTGLSFIDSTALGVLVVAGRRCTDAGGELRLVGLRPHVRKVFDITGLSGAFPILPDLATATPLSGV